MKARYIVLFITIILVGWGVKTLFSNKGKFELEEEDKKESQVRYVKIIEAKAISNPIIIEGYGRISTSQKVDISAEVQGMLIQGSRALKPGVTFRKGELICTIRNNDARFALQARKSSYLNIIANVLPDLKLDFPGNYQSWLNFYESIKINDVLPDFPEPKSQKEKTFISLKNIFTEYYNIKSDEEKLWKYGIIAPFDGSITEVFAEPGSVVNPGTRIATIIRTGDLEVEIPVDARNIANVRLNAKVDLKASSGTAVYEGKVVRIGQFVNVTTQSIPVYVAIIKKKEDVLYNGMYLTAEIQCGEMENTVKIPRRALPDEAHYYGLKKTTDTIESKKNKFIPKKDSVINAYRIVKKKLTVGFVLKNDILALEIKDGEKIVAEPLIKFNKETLFLPLNPNE